jgi:hypothetical protein
MKQIKNRNPFKEIKYNSVRAFLLNFSLRYFQISFFGTFSFISK